MFVQVRCFFFADIRQQVNQDPRVLEDFSAVRTVKQIRIRILRQLLHQGFIQFSLQVLNVKPDAQFLFDFPVDPVVRGGLFTCFTPEYRHGDKFRLIAFSQGCSREKHRQCKQYSQDFFHGVSLHN